MTRTLTIELPEEVFRFLAQRATGQGKTPEALAAEWLARSVASGSDDPLMKWAGAVDSDAADVAERHDDYLGQALYRELQGGGHE